MSGYKILHPTFSAVPPKRTTSSLSSSPKKTVERPSSIGMSEFRQRTKKSVPSYYEWAKAGDYPRTRGKGHGPDGMGIGSESARRFDGMSGDSFCGTRKGRSVPPTSLWGPEWDSGVRKRQVSGDPSLYRDHDPLIQGRTKNVIPNPNPRPHGIKRVSHNPIGPLTADMVVHGKKKVSEPSSPRDHTTVIPQSVPSLRIPSSASSSDARGKLQREPSKSSIVPRPIPTGGVFPEEAPRGVKTQRAFGSSAMKDTLTYASAGMLRADTMFTPRSSSVLTPEVLSARKENEQMYRHFRARQHLSSSSLREHLYETPVGK